MNRLDPFYILAAILASFVLAASAGAQNEENYDIVTSIDKRVCRDYGQFIAGGGTPITVRG